MSSVFSSLLEIELALKFAEPVIVMGFLINEDPADPADNGGRHGHPGRAQHEAKDQQTRADHHQRVRPLHVL